VSTFDGRAKFGSANISNKDGKHLTHFHTHLLIVEMILIQYPKICELPFIHNEQFSSKIIYNETRTYSKNLKGKSWNVKSNPFLRFFNIDLD